MSQQPEQQEVACGRTLLFKVEDREFSTSTQYLMGAEIKKIAGIPLESELYLKVSAPWKDEPIPNDKAVDLARPGIEGFYILKKLKFILDCKEHESAEQYVTGAFLRNLGKIPAGYNIYLAIQGPYEDELINDEDRVDLARPGIENFYSCKPNTTNG